MSIPRWRKRRTNSGGPMALTLEDIEFLRGDRARDMLAAYADCDLTDANTLQLLTRLRASLTPREASAVLQTLQLREKATTKFPRYGSSMLFTDDALQQASGPAARRYRARLFGARSVLDLCCGIGSDTLAFAAAGSQALGLEIDPVRIAIARHNAEAMNLDARFEVADVRASIPAGYDCIFFDPSRRDERGRRIRDVERQLPPLSLVKEWRADEICVKLSPAVDRRQLESYGGCLEFISVAGDLSEALLWTRRPCAPPLATKLVDGAAYHLNHRAGEPAAIAPPKSWLVEPDPAVLRAGLVQRLAQDLNATMLDDSIAYLSADERIETPWARYWAILDWMPFQLKRLRRYLAERGVNKVTVKKRGFPMPPEQLKRQLRLKKGSESRVLVMTRHRGQPIAIICREPSFG
ncbi:MAG: methyltransferase domain-containing protein [Chloroflexi bacterium]|nr:methyltransferase domain-containing protein [Chloroflexota bacterium]